MEIQQLQQKSIELINNIDKKLGVKHTNELLLMHMTEELGEVARQIINPLIKRDKVDIKNLEEEIADMILMLAKLADNNHINMESAIINKINKLKQRHNL